MKLGTIITIRRRIPIRNTQGLQIGAKITNWGAGITNQCSTEDLVFLPCLVKMISKNALNPIIVNI